MGMSWAVLAVVGFLDLMAFVLAIGAEQRRSTGRVVPDEYDDRTYCAYDSDASTAYGLGAFGALLVSQVLVTAVTRCLCFGRGLGGVSGGKRTCAVTSLVVSWLSFVVAEACLLAGSAKNAYHTKYLGYYTKHDLTSCAALRKGVFGAAAALVLIYMVASLFQYWSYFKADTGGWVKHHNEGIGMTDHDPQRSEFEGSKP